MSSCPLSGKTIGLKSLVLYRYTILKLYFLNCYVLLLLAGFGNLRGHVELWDIQARKLISKSEAPDTTLLQWCPNGIHYLTATTAPRLRIGNGYKIWHHSGTLLHEKSWANNDELYDVIWQIFPPGVFKDPQIQFERVEGIETTQPLASKQVYRPPGARGKVIHFKLHDDDELPGNSATPSKAALKQKKKREAKKAREKQENANGGEESEEKEKVSSGIAVLLTGDVEKDKKIKNLKKKLDAISKLKEQQAAGKPLEVNQISKIKGEDDLLKELKALQI